MNVISFQYNECESYNVLLMSSSRNGYAQNDKNKSRTESH